MASIKNAVAAAVTATLTLGMASAVVAADSGSSTMLDPQADALLKKMSDYIGKLKSYSVETYVIDDQIMGDGFKLSLLKSSSIKAQPPDRFYFDFQGVGRDQEVFFDGSRAVVNGKQIGMFVEAPMSGDGGAVLDTIIDALGVEIPAHDLLTIDSYTPLMEPVEESAYLGTVETGGVTCRHLAFRTDEVDWQLWVEDGDRPLPCRYTITSRWVYGAPQYTVGFTNWQVNSRVSAKDFTFTPSEGAKSTTLREYREALEQAEAE